MPYAEVAVDSVAPEQTYTYAVPPHLQVQPGQAVWVPFGRASTLTQGLVFRLKESSDLPRIKARSEEHTSELQSH